MDPSMLTPEQLKRATLEHFAAESQLDVDWVCDTVAAHANYEVVAPCYDDDPQAMGRATVGKQAVRELWQGALDRFAEYRIECLEDELLIVPEQAMVFAQVRIAVTPKEDFEGFPAGKPISYKVGALCHFDAQGKLARETVFGSMPTVLMGLRRMREFLRDSAGATA
jgi:hypothetical protein